MAKNKRSGREMFSRDTGPSVAFDRLLRAGNLKPVIVHVEGDNDISFIRWFTDQKVTINQNNGKEAALAAVAIAIRANRKGIVAIVDSDFDNILKIGPDQNVFRTDTHDIETMILKEGLFRASEDLFRDENKSNNFTYDDIWNSILNIGKKIGKLRLISAEKDLGLDFKEAEQPLVREDIITLNNGKIVFDFYKYIHYCVPYSSGHNRVVREIENIEKKDNREFDTWQICRGHDLSLLISIFYSKKMFGRRNITREEVETLLQSVYRVSRKIKKTNLYQDIKEWQTENCEWKILNDHLQ